MDWIVSIVLGVIVVLQLSYARYASRKLNYVNEYVQFLLFHPNVYNDHRAKLISFLEDNKGKSITDIAMGSYFAIEQMAKQLEDTILLANVSLRSNPSSINEIGS